MQKIGKYDVLERIGVGGFGEVYKGRDPLIKRYVAIKTCSSDDPKIRQRFFQEAEIAGNLHHRNITTVYDFGLQGDLPYLVQEYLSGEDLDRKIKRGDYLPYPEKLFYLLQIARGLAHAHSKGIVHRDVKPGNVRILSDGTVKILDFGIAKLAQQETGLTQTGMTLGTAAYLAPEQIRGEPAGLYTDVFSFGILAYELLAYERPFPGQQISVVIHQILDLEPRPLIEKWPAAPPEIVAVIGRCLHKNPVLRFANAGEVLQALELVQKKGQTERRLLEGEGTSKLDASPARRSQAAAEPPPTQALPATPSKPLPRPTLDDIGFFPEGSEVGAPTVALRKRPSRSPRLLLATLVIVAAVAGAGAAWWRGYLEVEFPWAVAEEGPIAEGPQSPALVDGTVTADEPAASMPAVPADGSGAPDGGGPALGETEGVAGEPDGDTEPGAAGGPVEGSAQPPPVSAEPAPPVPAPAEPRQAILVLEPPGWTSRMTAEVGGTAYPLLGGRDLALPPGSHEVRYELQMEDYHPVATVSVELVAGERKIVAPAIPKPGALSVRPLPNRPRGEVLLDGELLGTTPITRRLTGPGNHRIEILAVDGGEQTLERQMTIRSGQETVLSFDLDSGELKESEKPLAL